MTHDVPRDLVRASVAMVLTLGLLASPSTGGEHPFFITYTHRMEEPGNLELATENVTGRADESGRFLGITNEFEYGVKAWWTTELYLDAQSTAGQGALFTGYRWENRFRLMPREHWINPVLYLEFENINGADRALLGVVGHDGQDDLRTTNQEGRLEKKRELEAKLILGSYVKGWIIAENFIAEKNVRHAPFEFGYSVAASRPFALPAKPNRCSVCAENFQAGMELYGGLGTHDDFGLHETSHYLAPVLAWTLPSGTTFKVSPGFGLTPGSASLLFRFGVSYEIAQFGRLFRKSGDRR